jgi:putative sigma-54 modulation protein
MELAINASNIEMSKETISQIKEKSRKVFARISDYILAVKLTIEDVNGPKGGIDKKCVVVVHCYGMPTVVASNNQQSSVGAVNLALTKARTALIKKIKRNQCNRPQVKEVDENEVIEQIQQ